MRNSQPNNNSLSYISFIPETITKHLAVEWGENGIRLMCVAPGPIEDTEGYNRLGKTLLDLSIKILNTCI